MASGASWSDREAVSRELEGPGRRGVGVAAGTRPASTEKEKQAWLADHPEQEWPEHECALSDAEGIALSRWRKRRARKLGFPL